MLSPTEVPLVLGATMRLTRLVTNDDFGAWFLKEPLDAWMHGHPKDPVPPEDDGTALGPNWERLSPQDTPGTIQSNPGRLMTSGRGWLRYHDYLKGLECPHCVGFWIGAGVLATTYATRNTRLARPWRFVMAALSLNTAAVAAGDAIKYWD